MVEDLYADGHLRELVRTAMHVWGVNIPAHTITVKWTQAREEWRTVGRLSPTDVMGMIGRAGLQLYVRGGVGVVITTQCEQLFTYRY